MLFWWPNPDLFFDFSDPSNCCNLLPSIGLEYFPYFLGRTPCDRCKFLENFFFNLLQLHVHTLFVIRYNLKIKILNKYEKL
jgi:hypothetical protein